MLALTTIMCNKSGFSQSASAIKPKIMVIPKSKEGENLKSLYDSTINLRLAITSINKALISRGANLVSFDAKLKEVSQNLMLNKASGNVDDFRSHVLQASGTDIYVTVELSIVDHSSMAAHSVTVIAEAFQTGTGNYLGNMEGRSRINTTSDIGLLTTQAMESIADAFLAMVQEKFNDIRENGQSIFVQFTLGRNSSITFDSEIGNEGKMLSEIIDEWFQKNTVKSVFNNQGITSNMLIISDARIPLRNPSNPNANYTGQNFFTDINRFFKTLGIQVKREIGTNNKLLLTISN